MKAYARRISVLVVGFVMIASLVAVATRINAQENQEGGSGLSISPTRTELRIQPGQSDKVEISIRNVTRGAIVAKPFISDFESDDETGEPKLYANTDKRNSASISSFVAGLQDVPLQPGENKTLTYNVSIPGNAAPGGYYGAVTYRAVPANQAGPESGEVALTANVASLVLIEVPGDITEQIQLTNAKIGKTDNSKKQVKFGSFFTSKPDKAAITVKNNGNSFSKPFGTVSLTNMSGDQVYSYELNNATPRSNILPKSSRTFSDEIKSISKPGRYTLTANISHGTGGEVITKKVSFWYVPVWLLVALGILLLGLVAGLYVLYRKQFAGRRKRK
jgi:hypothetical protein